MNIKHIIIPGNANWLQWIRFIAENRYQQLCDQLIVDFQELGFVAPYHQVPLACLIEEYHLAGIPIEFLCNEETIAGRFLLNTGFLHYWTPDYKRNNYDSSDSQFKTLKIWKLDPAYLDSYVQFAGKFFENHFLHGKDLSPFNIAVAELLNNIVDHAQSRPGGYIVTQYYPNADYPYLEIAICDFGCGIVDAINNYRQSQGFQMLQPGLAVREALKKGVSTQSTPRNRGFGWDNVISNIKPASRSSIEIITNKIKTELRFHGGMLNDQDTPLQVPFPGTCIVIKLTTDHLQERGEESEIEIDIF